jgi:cytochrome c5
MAELKPCPFCGGEAEVDTPQYWDGACGRKTYAIYCTACRCRTPDYMGLVGAKEAWDRRVEDVR